MASTGNSAAMTRPHNKTIPCLKQNFEAKWTWSHATAALASRWNQNHFGMYATGSTVITRCTIATRKLFRKVSLHRQEGKWETKLFVSTGSAGSTRTETFIQFQVIHWEALGEVFLAENFYEKNFLVPRFNALSTLLTASLNLDPNRQEDNTSEIRGKTNKIKQAQMRITETCGSSDSRSLFLSHSKGSQSDAAIALLPSWKNTYVVSLQNARVSNCKEGPASAIHQGLHGPSKPLSSSRHHFQHLQNSPS